MPKVIGWMESLVDLPNGVPLLRSLQLTPERLSAGTKIAVSIPLLRGLLCSVVSTLPFDDDFYLATYADVAEAYRSGEIPDLHTHFVHTGYFEGRLGSMPDFDEDFYQEAYPDVALAVANGEPASGLDHYIRIGAVEGRFANSADMQAWEQWLHILNGG